MDSDRLSQREEARERRASDHSGPVLSKILRNIAESVLASTYVKAHADLFFVALGRMIPRYLAQLDAGRSVEPGALVTSHRDREIALRSAADDCYAVGVGELGKLQRQLSDRPLAGYAAELEARHGRLPWLHPVEIYGSEAPDFERVVAYPVGNHATDDRSGR